MTRASVFFVVQRLRWPQIGDFSQKKSEKMSVSSNQLTQLLAEWSDGNEAALENLMPLVYDELRRMARRYMNRQPSGHTLQTTELIHEAYLKLAGKEEHNWQNRAHFFGVAAQVMRHILVDYARARSSQKRGGDFQRAEFEEAFVVSSKRVGDIVALDDALNSLTELDERKCRVVELKFFGGLKIEEIAEVLKVSPVTVKRDWRFARTWLLRELSDQ